MVDIKIPANLEFFLPLLPSLCVQQVGFALLLESDHILLPFCLDFTGRFPGNDVATDVIDTHKLFEKRGKEFLAHLKILVSIDNI